MNPLLCERCGRDLESDDAISIIEGICCACRRASVKTPAGRAGTGIPRTPPPAAPPRSRPPVPAGSPAQMRQPINPPRRTIVTPSSMVEPGLGTTRTRTRRRDLLIGVGFGMILTIGATGLMMFKKSDPLQLRTADTSAPLPVRVAVNPAWSDITLDDHPIGPADDAGILNFTIPADGEKLHWLNVTADGYHPVRRPLTVYGGVGDLTIELIRKPITVTLRSDPPEAQVWIDNQLKGSTPLELTLLPWENAKVTLKRAGYAELTREVSQPQRGSTLDLDFPLIPAGLLVRVESDPPGAIIAIDGRVAGAAPIDIPVDDARRGKSLSITATLAGYAQAVRKLTIPGDAGAEPLTALLTLTRPHSEMTIVSNPPNAEIRIDGRPIGRAPVVATFTQEQIGARIEIEGAIAGSHIGKLATRVPPAGENKKVTLALSPSGKRVAYIVLSPTGTGTDHVLLMDHLVEQIHRLEDSQQFGIIACTVDGVRRWPEDGEWATATSENKIRGYDVARAIRPAARGPLNDALTAIGELQPEIIWLFAAGEVNRESLDLIADAAQGTNARINVVKIGSPGRDNWLGEWARIHDGIVSFIGPAASRAVARDSTAVD
mgnify:CR=1 FL=1